MTVGEVLDSKLVNDLHVVKITMNLDKEKPTSLIGLRYEGKIRSCRDMEVSYLEWTEDEVDIIVRE